jgi:hypothetical protein
MTPDQEVSDAGSLARRLHSEFAKRGQIEGKEPHQPGAAVTAPNPPETRSKLGGEPEREGGTPRTDAMFTRDRPRVIYWEFARTLERELAAKDARIAELEGENTQLRSMLGRIGEIVAGPVFDAQDVSAEFLERLVVTVRNRVGDK